MLKFDNSARKTDISLFMQKKSGIPPIPEAQILKLLSNSELSIRRFSSIIFNFDGFIYSGVYAKSHGYEGILTAGHCASAFLCKERFVLMVSPLHHRLTVWSSSVEHVPIDHDESEDYTNDGPDLSFVILRDGDLRNLLRHQNFEFFDLDNQNTGIFRDDLSRFNWCVAGSATESTEVKVASVNAEKHQFISAVGATMQGNLVEFEERKNFDYVKLSLLSGSHKFPMDFDGVSGGGIWYQRFSTKDGKVYTVEPILAGIAVWQSKPKGEQRIITGHAFNSIYGRVRQILAAKRTAGLALQRKLQ